MTAIELSTTSIATLEDVLVTPCDPWPHPYYLADGLRRVKPYHYTYNTYCKERWRNRSVLEIFTTEFRERSHEYYRNAIETGQITLNGRQLSSPDEIITNGAIISHTQHRHEPPVSAQPIQVVHEDEDMIVINKPAGIPVHPAGRYNFNSVVEIMRAERGLGFDPLPCNRLDRLTSGIMFVGKHPRAAERLTSQMMNRGIQKEYIARVIGRFPDGRIVCDKAIKQISPKLGLNRVRATGKHSHTIFKRISYHPPKEQQPESHLKLVGDDLYESDAGFSIVRCTPLTGRTHQIRVHLQYLGHPIANDPIYCNALVWGSSLGKDDSGSEGDDDAIANLSRMGKEEAADAAAYRKDILRYERQKAEKLSGKLCTVCSTPLYHDPGPQELGIYLHAYKYACIDGRWSYETPLPTWAEMG